jgi:FtsZ-interacting cell division protein ZipA
MKKFTTKKLAIAFVAIAFLFIFGFTVYRGLTGQFQSHPEVAREVKKSTKKKDTSKKEETKQEETKQIESQEESKKTDTKSSDSSSKQETKKQEIKKTETKSASSKQDTKKTETKSSSTKHETKKTETNTSSSKHETSAPQHVETPKQDTPVKQTVSVRVIGVNSTMMQGNIEVNSSSTAYSVLRELAKQNGKSISTKGFGSTVYVSGIDGLKEFDHGPSSGWMYKVNGTPPNIGAGAYKVKAGDTVIWYYVNIEQ